MKEKSLSSCFTGQDMISSCWHFSVTHANNSFSNLLEPSLYFNDFLCCVVDRSLSQLPHFYVILNGYTRQVVVIHQGSVPYAPSTGCPLHYLAMCDSQPWTGALEFFYG